MNHHMMPYIKGLGKNDKKICSNMAFKYTLGRGTTIKDLVNHKYRDTILQKCGVIYRYKCGRVDCEDEYIGESGHNICRNIQRTQEVPIIHP